MKHLISIVLATVVLLIPFQGAFAATTADVTVTATPSYVAITNAPTPSTWIINGIKGNSRILTNTTYYSNTTNSTSDTTAPAATVADDDCRFTVTNAGNVPINLTAAFPNFAGGDTMTNSNTGANGVDAFGSYVYASGMTFATDKKVAPATGSAAFISSLAAGATKKWGLMLTTRTDAWTSGTSMTATVTISATAS